LKEIDEDVGVLSIRDDSSDDSNYSSEQDMYSVRADTKPRDASIRNRRNRNEAQSISILSNTTQQTSTGNKKEGKLYQVKILSHQGTEPGNRIFKVHWFGYTDEHDQELQECYIEPDAVEYYFAKINGQARSNEDDDDEEVGIGTQLEEDIWLANKIVGHKNRPRKYLLTWDNFEGHTVQDPKLTPSTLQEEYRKELAMEGKSICNQGWVVLKDYEEEMAGKGKTINNDGVLCTLVRAKSTVK
jgi:hypothetical protein